MDNLSGNVVMSKTKTNLSCPKSSKTSSRTRISINWVYLTKYLSVFWQNS